ncbi:hypothetical protein AVEN_119714-1 [Araneus ventricosus]|uniref:Uncharacterized protein n=1 Tax=Araneus ventricosus TaxID=182803 RepID=A0A4Y2PL61_ARAVE|nr:hypothetical protein AVEN_119714-1 [Araneus ventricosus]
MAQLVDKESPRGEEQMILTDRADRKEKWEFWFAISEFLAFENICLLTLVRRRHIRARIVIECLLECLIYFDIRDGGGDSASSLSNPRVAKAGSYAQKTRRNQNALGVYSSHFITPNPAAAAAEDFLLFLEEIRQEIHDFIIDKLQQKKAIKWYCVSKIRFHRDTPDGDVMYVTPYFRSKVAIELDSTLIEDHIGQAFERIK